MEKNKTIKPPKGIIERYFSECEETGKPLAVSDLALALGFESRIDLLKYNENPSYAKAIKRALLKIEGYNERKLFDRGCSSGARFNLASNFKGWGDKPDNTLDETDEKLDELLKQISESMQH